MTLRYTPYERLFSDIMKEFDYDNLLRDTSYFTYSSKDSYIIEMPLVGVPHEELEVKVEKKELTVITKPSKTSKFIKATNLAFKLKEDSDEDNVTAKLENGLLTVTIPKKASTEKKSVNVKVN